MCAGKSWVRALPPFDVLQASYWASGPGSTPIDFHVDLGSTQRVSRIEIDWQFAPQVRAVVSVTFYLCFVFVRSRSSYKSDWVDLSAL